MKENQPASQPVSQWYIYNMEDERYWDPLMKNHFNWLFLRSFFFFASSSKAKRLHTHKTNRIKRFYFAGSICPCKWKHFNSVVYLSKINFLPRISSFIAIYFQWLLVSFSCMQKKKANTHTATNYKYWTNCKIRYQLQFISF